uniref:N-acetylneuraminate lyase n=1 Tax=Varanus komodoensis TaxID=61221 RepID=A0A8D2J2W8_VARKO
MVRLHRLALLFQPGCGDALGVQPYGVPAVSGGRGGGDTGLFRVQAPRRRLELGWRPHHTHPRRNPTEINLSVIGRYVDYLVKEQGVRNVFVNGTTGEGLSLSIQERKQLAEEWVAKGKDKLDHVIIHVGTLSLPESKELAKHAAEIGADGIAVITPSFFKQVNKDGLVAFFRDVASQAPSIPFYYYHIPTLTGIQIRAEELLDGMKEQIPSFQGLKFSDTDLLDFGRCESVFPLFTGLFFNSTYNYFGKANNLMLEAFVRGDLHSAQKHQVYLRVFYMVFVFLLIGFGVPQIKAVMTLVSGIPMGPPRLPLLSASAEFIDEVKAKLESLRNHLSG